MISCAAASAKSKRTSTSPVPSPPAGWWWKKRRRCWSQEPSAWRTSGYRVLWKERLGRMKPSPSTGTPNSWEISRRAVSSLRKAAHTREPLHALHNMNLPISIRGARQHNLRNLDLDLPSNKLIAFCGPSGSGKSSLAFDTLFSESRRRFLDCLSARSRQGMDQPEKPECICNRGHGWP